MLSSLNYSYYAIGGASDNIYVESIKLTMGQNDPFVSDYKRVSFIDRGTVLLY